MTRLLPLWVLFSISLPSMAMDLTFLSGYQFNNDFEITAANNWPADPTPKGAPGDDVALKSGAVVSLAMDFVYKKHINQRIGIFVSHQQTEIDNNAGLLDRDIDITHAHVTSMNYYPRGQWEPFVLAGAGVGYFSPNDRSLNDVARFSAQIGAGANYKFTDNLLLRLDMRWLAAFFNNSSSVLCDGGCTLKIKSETYSQVQANAGIMFRF